MGVKAKKYRQGAGIKPLRFPSGKQQKKTPQFPAARVFVAGARIELATS